MFYFSKLNNSPALEYNPTDSSIHCSCNFILFFWTNTVLVICAEMNLEDGLLFQHIAENLSNFN